MATVMKHRLDPLACEDRPENVPAELVRDLGWAFGYVPVTYDEPFQDTALFFEPGAPPLMWMPDSVAGKPGVGSWILTRHADISRIYQEADLFSSEGVAAFQAIIGENWPSIPLGIDPPDHIKYRAILNPHFSPKTVGALDATIRTTALSLIDDFRAAGCVDVSYDFCRIFPVRVFMDVIGFPRDMFEQFVHWFHEILHSYDPPRIMAGLTEILAYLRGFIAERRSSPTSDVGSQIVNARIDGRPLTDDEAIGTMFFLWLGGIDTVAATLAMIFRRLGRDQAMQQRLRGDPALIPTAVEEFLRVQPIVQSQRLVKQDFEWHGQQIRKGDWVTGLVSAGNFDPAEFPAPREVRLDREDNRHFTLAGGPHRCLGSHLARRELRVALEVFLDQVPTFAIAEDDEGVVYPGLQSAVHLKLVW